MMYEIDQFITCLKLVGCICIVIFVVTFIYSWMVERWNVKFVKKQ
jgi:hypothetical protein